MTKISLIAALVIALLIAFPSATSAAPAGAACERPTGVQRLVFSAAKYPIIRRHFRRAV